MLLASRCLAAAFSAILLSLVFGGLASAAAPSSMLAGETLTGSATPPSGLPLTNNECSLGRTRTHFTFTGTASGPYAGTFTEAGHITYKLFPNTDTFFPEGGVVMHFSGRFTINSPSGSVTGRQTLDRTVSSGVGCDESPGGTSFVTAICQPLTGGVPSCTDAPVVTQYVARATKGNRVHVDKGVSMVTLSVSGDDTADQTSSIGVSFG